MERSASRQSRKKVVAVVGGGLVRQETQSEVLLMCFFSRRVAFDFHTLESVFAF